MEKKFVKIQSNINIEVTAGLQHQDHSMPDANIPDRLKIAPMWNMATCFIQVGAHFYPAVIAEWPTVKSLQEHGQLSISGFFDNADGEPEVEKKANDLEEKIETMKERIETNSGVKTTKKSGRSAKKTSLDDLAEQ